MQRFPEIWSDPTNSPLDFIIVGAGAAGAPLAARLVERGYTVLVVEMGPEKPRRPEGTAAESTQVPLLHIESTEDPRHSLRFFVKHVEGDPDHSQDPKVHLPPQGRRDERGIFYPRAQGVGGCTIHNAMITLCGLAEDWDEIAEATEDESWRGERMRAYFVRVEQCHYAQPSWWGRFMGRLGFGTGWENARHGFRGWLHTTMPDLRILLQDRQFVKVVLMAAKASLQKGIDRFGDLLRAAIRGRTLPDLDPNNWETMRQKEVGVTRIPCAITPNGERSSARERLLQLREHNSPHGERLHLLTEVCVTEVVLQKEADGCHRATGIKCLPRAHVYEADPTAVEMRDASWQAELITLHCQREIILCGGAFNSPQLLLLSGIGPEKDLEEHGIESRVPLAGVGQNLQDRYEVPIVAHMAQPFRSIEGITLSSAQPPDPYLKRWLENVNASAYRRGVYASNGGLMGILIRSPLEDSAPDLCLLALAANFPGYSVGFSKPDALNPSLAEDPPTHRRTVTWLVLKARTRAREGFVRLQDKNPFRRPEIDFRSFPSVVNSQLDPRASGQYPASEDKDLEALYAGVDFVTTMLQAGKDNGTIKDFQLPGLDRFAGNIRKWIKHVAWGHHACGTCRIGVSGDREAVLDGRFRVQGVKNLRVVDASIFPRIPGFFIVANIYMIAEKAADALTEDHPLPADRLASAVQEALRENPVLRSSAVYEARRLYPAAMEEAEAKQIVERRRAAGLINTEPDEGNA